MRKLSFLVIMAVLIFGALAADTQAYTILDKTDIQIWNDGSSTGVWTDVIGNPQTFDTFKAVIGGNKITFFTNWNPSKEGGVNFETADLFIDNGITGNWNLAINLSKNIGKVYANPTYQTSYDIFNIYTMNYGGKYGDPDQANPRDVPVRATSSSTTTTNVQWTYGVGGLNNEVEIDLSNLGIGPSWKFVWATATCANDAIGGVVPLPGAVLLLGSGLLRVLSLRRRS